MMGALLLGAYARVGSARRGWSSVRASRTSPSGLSRRSRVPARAPSG